MKIRPINPIQRGVSLLLAGSMMLEMGPLAAWASVDNRSVSPAAGPALPVDLRTGELSLTPENLFGGIEIFGTGMKLENKRIVDL